MKKVGLLICLLVSTVVLATGCQSIEKTEATVKKDVDSYIKKLGNSVGKLEKEAEEKFNALKIELKQDVKESEKFVGNEGKELISKFEEVVKEAKKLEVEGEGYLKNVHTHFTELLERQEAAIKKLVAAIESGTQTAYEEAKAEVEKIAAEIKGHKSTVNNLAK